MLATLRLPALPRCMPGPGAGEVAAAVAVCRSGLKTAAKCWRVR